MHHRRHANPKLNFENPLITYRYTHALSTQHDERAKPVNPSAVYLQYNIVPNSHRPRSQHITTLKTTHDAADIHDHDPFAMTFFPKERFSAKQAKQAPMHYSELGLTSWRPILKLHTLKAIVLTTWLCCSQTTKHREHKNKAGLTTPLPPSNNKTHPLPLFITTTTTTMISTTNILAAALLASSSFGIFAQAASAFDDAAMPLLRGRQLQTLDVNDWKIGNITLVPNPNNIAGQFQLTVDHGIGATGSSVEIDIYSDTSSTTTGIENCFSKGALIRGTVSATGIDTPANGLDTDVYDPNVNAGTSQYGKLTTFTWDFNSGITQNTNLYSETADAGGNTVAGISFCVKFTLKDSSNNDVNYKEYALAFSYTLDEKAELTSAVEVNPDSNVGNDGETQTFTVTAEICTADAVPAPITDPSALTPGTPVSLCIKSADYPEASIIGIDSLTYTAPTIEATQDAVTAGAAASFSQMDAPTLNSYGQYCRVQTLLLADFYPANGSDSVDVSGVAELRVGSEYSGRRVLAKIVPGRTLQESQQTFETTFRVNAAPAQEPEASAAGRVSDVVGMVSAVAVTGLSLLL